MADTLTLVIIRADGEESEEPVRPNDLTRFQQAVGGYIETVPYFQTYKGRRCWALCNEEGKLKGLPVNIKATRLWFEQLPGVEQMEPFSVAGDVLVGDVAIVFGDATLMEQL